MTTSRRAGTILISWRSYLKWRKSRKIYAFQVRKSWLKQSTTPWGGSDSTCWKAKFHLTWRHLGNIASWRSLSRINRFITPSSHQNLTHCCNRSTSTSSICRKTKLKNINSWKKWNSSFSTWNQARSNTKRRLPRSSRFLSRKRMCARPLTRRGLRPRRAGCS